MSDELKAVRRQKLAQLREKGDAYPNDYTPAFTCEEVHSIYGGSTLSNSDDTAVDVAGRIMLKRDMGKTKFLTIQDDGVRLQIYVSRGIVGDELFKAVGDWDIGDIIGCYGTAFHTRTGELTVNASQLRILVKSLLPLPDKFHGVADKDLQYRQRYVSLLANPDERKIFNMRANVIRRLRNYFHGEDYMEAETPILQPIPGGAAAKPFKTHCNALGTDFYLRIAQELYIKRLLVGGYNRVFEINRNFRNEGVSTRHNPEFTMLEFNAVYHTYRDFMHITEEILNGLCKKITGSEEIMYQGKPISFRRPFATISPTDAIQREHPDITDEQLDDEAFMRDMLNKAGVEVKDDLTKGELLLLMFEQFAEHTLQQPTFLIDYPAAASPLAKRNKNNPELAERFELFVAGRELANGFSELNDADAQAEIFKAQAELKNAGDDEAMYFDDDYITALQYGLPPNAGGGIGIDRLVMLFADTAAIRDVILFPQLRPINDIMEVKGEAK